MAIYQYGERIPQIGSASYISDTAVVIGDVAIVPNGKVIPDEKIAAGVPF